MGRLWFLAPLKADISCIFPNFGQLASMEICYRVKKTFNFEACPITFSLVEKLILTMLYSFKAYILS